MENFEERFEFEFILGKWMLSSAPQSKVDELATFYSLHYGIWSENAPYSNGKQIRLSSEKIKEWLNNDKSEVWTIRENGNLIGYAIVLRGKSGSKENVIWVTQFVVHVNYRNLGIGKYLLFRIWGFSSFFAWGLLTANPYAIRALEKATRRRCEPERIKRNSKQLLNFGKKNICYVNDNTLMEISESKSRINTEFFVDHSEISNMLPTITTDEKPWLLGDLEEGWEWFAFTFNDQKPIELSALEIESMLNASDKIARDAYGRMPMDNKSQKWSNYTKNEIDFIIEVCEITNNKSILDVGCGMGRHSLELSRRGFNVIGIDYAKELIDNANKKAVSESLNVTFLVNDITHSNSFESQSFDCILCVYDVIGSYADNTKNKKILSSISNLLKTGGKAVLSVMNLELTENIAVNKFNIEESTSELLSLPASNTMEKSGNIFNPEFFLLDENTKVVYRKEVFSMGNSCPIELIVRDRRYYMNEIIQMCEEVNLKVKINNFVCAGWKDNYSNIDKKAKEILLVCEKI